MGEGWSDFFVAQVGAAAALSGLVIVAVSINLQRILEGPQLPGRAAESLMTLIGALLVASAGLVPHQPIRALGAEIVAIGLVVWIGAIVFQIQALVALKNQPLKWWLPRTVISLVTAVPTLTGGALLWFGIPEGIYWAAGGVLTSLVAGMFNTWVLLIEILR